MIDLKLTELKLLNARYAEETLGMDVLTREGTREWSTVCGYLNDIAPEHEYCLMHNTEKKALNWIASRLESNSLVVEVGSFLGCSSAIMAHANPTLRIKSIDLFDKNTADAKIKNHYQTTSQNSWLKYFLGPGKIRSKSNVEHRLKHYPNLEFLEGTSPDDFLNTDITDIDLYFEDGTHKNPGLGRNIDFWEPRVRPGGLILLHDYCPWYPLEYDFKIKTTHPKRFIDVEKELSKLIERGYILEGTVSSLAILRKPR